LPLAVVVPDVPVIASCVVPVTAMFSVPLFDAVKPVLGMYCALSLCVPTTPVPVLLVIWPVVPFVKGAGCPTAVPSNRNCTLPVAVFGVTVALTVIFPFCITLVEFTVSCVVVATGAWVLLPQPSVKPRMQTSPSPSAARYRFLPGRKSSTSAASPVPPLNVHQPLPLAGAALPADRTRSVGTSDAISEDEFAVVLTVNAPVAAAALVTLMFNVPQVTPGGNVGQVIATVPVNPPLGVTVIVDDPIPPAVTGVAEPVTV